MKERAEQGGVFRVEDPFKDKLNERLQALVLQEKDIDHAQAKIDQLVEDMAAGREPNFDWVPDSIRVEVMSEWNEARQDLERFKEEQAEARQEMAAEHKEERLSAELQETAERSAKLSELESKFGEIPEEGTPIPQRQITTQIVRKPQAKGAVRRFFDRLAGNP